MYRNLERLLTTCALVAIFSIPVLGAGENKYVSSTDQLLTIHSVGILPATDNVNGLYARYAEGKLKELLKNNHQFNGVELRGVDASRTLSDYESERSLVMSVGKKSGADALIGAHISKTKKGVTLILDLFLTADGQVLIQETETHEKQFQTSLIESRIADLYKKLLDHLPYKGLVMSRQGQRVTVSLGSADGVHEDSVLTVEQVITLRRHPKFKFFVGTEREILGKIKILKSDDTLSFGVVVQEKEPGVIDKDSKIAPLDFVTYKDPTLSGIPTTLPEKKAQLQDDTVAFGKAPNEWVLEKKPTLGKVGLGLGLGSIRLGSTLQTAGSMSGDASIYPSLTINSEIWVTENWFVGGFLRQGIFSVSNPLGGTPSPEAASNTFYNFYGGYKLLLNNDFFGPQMNAHLGYQKYSMFIDAATPMTFTSTSYTNFYLGFGGSMPVNTENTYYIDINLDLGLWPNLTETPQSSGATSSNRVTQFLIGGSHKLTNQFWISVHLGFEFYSSTFSGTGTRADPGVTSTQNLGTLLTGVEYWF